MKKIGIFGGTFDPFTVAHREIVKQALVQGLVDTVYVCPTIVTWHREGYTPWLDDRQKLDTIRRLLDTDECVKYKAYVWDDDLMLRKFCEGNDFLTEKYVNGHRFIDTLLKIKSSHEADDEIWPILGPDEFEKFEDWYAYDSIFKLSAGLLVVTDEDGNGRDGRPVDPVVGNPIIKSIKPVKIAKKFMNVSATEARDAYRAEGEYGWNSYLESALREVSGKKPNEILLRTPIFDVVKGAKTATGLEPVLIDAPDWVTIIVEDGEKSQVLVERQIRYGNGREVAEFPCGMVERGEDPKDAAIRELREETGISILDPSRVLKLGSVNPNPAFMTNTMHYFYVNLEVAKFVQLEQRLDEHEKIKVEWRDTDKFFAETERKAAEGGNETPAILLAAMKLYQAWQADPVRMSTAGESED